MLRYLPTLPQDELFEVKRALDDGNFGHRMTMYKCSNGHIYSVGECGKPMQMSRCPQCGEEIGGNDHIPVQGSKQIAGDQIKDNTLPGYSITESTESDTTTTRIDMNTRKLNKTGFYLERFLLNACMYLAIGDYDERLDQVKNIMAHKESDPKSFFWNHMMKDLRLAASSLNLNIDEVILLWHRSCVSFLETNTSKYKKHFQNII